MKEQRFYKLTSRPLLAILGALSYVAFSQCPAIAGHYIVSYAATLTVDGKVVTPVPAGNLFSAGGNCNTNATLAVTATLTWTPYNPQDTSPAPTSVIVEENEAAGGGGSGPPSSNEVTSDGFGDPSNVTVTPIVNNGIVVGEDLGGTSNGSHWMSVPTGGSSTTSLPTRTETVTFTGGADGSYVIGYTVTPYPVVLSLTGPVQDTSFQLHTLIGIPCSASYTAPPGCSVQANTSSWNLTGSVFKSWAATPTATTYTGLTQPLNTATINWYWNDQSKTTETVNYTSTVLPPTGHGSPMTVTAAPPITVWVPAWTCSGSGTTMSVSNSYPPLPKNTDYWFFAGTATQPGMTWTATVNPTAAMPANLVSSGIGSLAFVQTITPDVHYFDGTNVYHRSVNNQNGLDTSFPYGWVSSTANNNGGEAGTTDSTNDSPGIDVNSLTAKGSYGSLTDVFTNYLMYEPAGSAQWVPLASTATTGWTPSGSATIPTNGTIYAWSLWPLGTSAGSVTPSTESFHASNAFPVWTQDSGNVGTWVLGQ